MFVEWWVFLIRAMLHELMCSNILIYVYMSSIHIFCAIMLNNIPQKVANVSMLLCVHNCKFADEVCVWSMSTLLWTCQQNLGYVKGLNVESISCYFMLQKTYLGVTACIFRMHVMFLHIPCMYFRLQPVCSISLCSVGFANVIVFFSKCVLQKWP